MHNGHDHDGLLTENATPTSRLALPAQADVEPGAFGGIESQLATNGVVFTTTFHGDLYALNAATGKILLKTPLSAGTNAPVAVDGDHVIASVPTSGTQQPLVIACKLGAKDTLPDTVGA